MSNQSGQRNTKDLQVHASERNLAMVFVWKVCIQNKERDCLLFPLPLTSETASKVKAEVS